MELDGADFQLRPWDGSPGTFWLGKERISRSCVGVVAKKVASIPATEL
jgi:hypothetical protein